MIRRVNNKFVKFDVVHSMVGGAMSGDDNGPFIFYDGQTPPTEVEIDAEVVRLEAAEPMRILREQRNHRLEETDWWAVQDRVMPNEQQIYRQQLRDLPATASPTLNEFRQLSGVAWPEKPS